MIELNNFADESRVWIYQSNHPFDESTSAQIREELQAFARQWVSHNRALKAHAEILHNQFIVLVVDETNAGASGCSIDASVHFLKNLQAKYGVDLFDRMKFAYLQKDEIKLADRLSFAQLYASGDITDSTLVVDTLVQKKRDLGKMIKPLRESWHARMV